MLKKVIVNADDFGLSYGVVLGILQAHKEGILTSTTCMMNMDNIEIYIQEALKYPNLGLGVHLNITLGKSLTGKLCNEQGLFSSKNKKTIENQDDLYDEWKTQIEKFISITGFKPTHLDSHHHVHLKPGNIDIALKLAHEYDIPLRLKEYYPTNYEFVRFETVFYNDSVSIESLKKTLEFDDDLFEIMCHPAYVDYKLMSTSSYNVNRCKELEILCNDEIKELYKDKLINYSNVKPVQ